MISRVKRKTGTRHDMLTGALFIAEDSSTMDEALIIDSSPLPLKLLYQHLCVLTISLLLARYCYHTLKDPSGKYTPRQQTKHVSES